MLDLRIPSGWFFAIIGFALTAMGVLTPELRSRMSAANVNLWAGLGMLAFGLFLLGMARRKKQR